MRTFRFRLPLLLAVVFAVAGCRSDDADDATPTGPDPVPTTETYEATTFGVREGSAPTVDVLAAGGTLTIVVNPDSTTTGSLVIPPSLTGAGALTFSMAGRLRRTGLMTVRFEQSADSFVRDLAWTVGDGTLSVNDQSAGAARFTITLTRR